MLYIHKNEKHTGPHKTFDYAAYGPQVGRSCSIQSQQCYITIINFLSLQFKPYRLEKSRKAARRQFKLLIYLLAVCLVTSM